ncbi:TonB-dependent receptor [Kriegella aquimaris]|uniref:TonB-dependent receptor n=1 Tax=Kriegella aquimaris TaxID=192904 RepID=A0A1G9M6U9_9FLAO|nr:TonB-dependent receptor [Kriegella aquimaris]SDL69843.1 TonB-dependent receptor [Kriegella aquimaris]
MKLNLKLIVVALFLVQFTFSQKGEVTGKLIDVDFQDPVAFANILVKGTTTGTTSDFDGAYTIPLDEGSYTVTYSFLGYKTVEITDVIIKAGEVTTVDVSMETLAEGLDEVIVAVSVKKNTETAVLGIQKKAVNVLDGLSAETFKKSGSSNVASAIKTVPGVSVQGGKYVYVRGLGDRYTKSILNGVDIPGLDPDRNTIQLDIFPTNIIDNVLVLKSASADLPADFTGGIVNIVTKDYPTQKEYSLSLSGTFNPDMHFNGDYLDYQGGDSDFLGFDDGTRDVPINENQDIPNTYDYDPRLTTITKQFNPVLGAMRSNSGMDYSLGFTMGNQFNVGEGENRLGFLASLSYKNSTTYYEGAENNFYRRNSDKSEFELETDRTQQGDIGQNNVLVSGLLGTSFKTARSKYKLNLLHLQNGESTAGLFNQTLNFSDFVNFSKDNIEYTQRSITNALLTGTHTSEDASWTSEWAVSPTLSKIQDKDIRTTSFQVEDGVYSIAQNNQPKRIWRDLEEINGVAKLDFTKRYELGQKDAKLKFGAYGAYKTRDFSILNFEIQSSNFPTVNYGGNANNILLEENLWTVINNSGSHIDPDISIAEPANTYEAVQQNIAGYVSNEFKVGNKLRTILGLRMEKFESKYTGEDNKNIDDPEKVIFDKETIIDELDFFPTANLIYELTEQVNLRGSYARTTARPSFKEASIAKIFDPLSNNTFIGNINLQPTYINNFDFRVEWFGERAEMIALSSFYKKFKDPIELTYFESSTDNFQPQNLGDANVLGLEFEIRKNLGFIVPALNNFSFNINTSIIKSTQVYSDQERNLRELGLRDGQTLGNDRELQGQSPFLINTGINYEGEKNGMQMGLFYNVQGKTLQVVGNGFVPDVYTMPYHNLNFNLTKSFGVNNNQSINFKIANLMNDDVESEYESYGATNKTFSKRSPGQAFSIGYSIKF